MCEPASEQRVEYEAFKKLMYVSMLRRLVLAVSSCSCRDRSRDCCCLSASSLLLRSWLVRVWALLDWASRSAILAACARSCVGEVDLGITVCASECVCVYLAGCLVSDVLLLSARFAG